MHYPLPISKSDKTLAFLSHTLFLLPFFLIQSHPCFGLQWNAAAIEKALTNATYKVNVRVLDSTTRPHPKFHAIRSTQVEILDTISSLDGQPPSEKVLEIETEGGEWNGVGSFYSGIPILKVGETYTVTLKRKQSNVFSIVAGEFGVESGELSPQQSTRNRTDGANGQGTGQYLFWPQRVFPIPFVISSPTFYNRSNYVSAVVSAFQTWQTAPSSVYFLGIGCTSYQKSENDGVNTVLMVTDSWAYDTNIIALTRNFYLATNASEAGRILDTDILINGVNFSFTTTNETGKYDIQEILTHEVGHLIGFGHEVSPFDSSATMYATALPNETTKRTLKDNDLAILRSAYPVSGGKMSFTYIPCGISESLPRACSITRRPESPQKWPFLLWCLLPFLVGRLFLFTFSFLKRIFSSRIGL